MSTTATEKHILSFDTDERWEDVYLKSPIDGKRIDADEASRYLLERFLKAARNA